MKLRKNLLLIASHSKRIKTGGLLFVCGFYAIFADKFGQREPMQDWLWNTIYLDGFKNIEVHQGKSYVLF